MALNDNSPMPQKGKFFGVAMTNVPAWHLLWLLENNKCNNEVKQYILENKSLLEDEANKSRGHKK